MDNDKTILGKMETLKHIQSVRSFLYLMIEELDNRARNHDQSKLESPEAEIFGEYGPELAKVEYGSEDYKKLLEKVKPAIENHYSKNRHHPEFHKDGIDDFDLVDLMECICDWKAATQRNKNGNIRKSLEINAERYKISPQMLKILSNTVDRYF
jgi:hypothetical protein